MAGVTQLLLRWSEGDQVALEHLMPLVYDELRRLASGFLCHDLLHQTLQPTALVHEAYLRMLGQAEVAWQSRAGVRRPAQQPALSRFAVTERAPPSPSK